MAAGKPRLGRSLALPEEKGGNGSHGGSPSRIAAQQLLFSFSTKENAYAYRNGLNSRRRRWLGPPVHLGARWRDRDVPDLVHHPENDGQVGPSQSLPHRGTLTGVAVRHFV